jgi:GT2 family glycosyltransferase
VAIAQGAIGVYQRGGWSGFKNVMRNKLDARFSSELIELKNSSNISLENSSGRDYPDWVLRYDALKDEHLEKFRAAVEGLCSRPKISIVMPVYAPQKDDLFRAIASVRAQIYPYWELCICDDASPDGDVRNALEDQAKSDSRIKLIFHEKNKHISAATNSAISLATGDYIAFLDHDDELRAHALLNVVQGLECHPAAEIFYSDEDKIDGNGRRFDPYFKPGFNLGLLRSHNYMCHFAVYRSSLIHKLGGLRVGFEGAQDYDLVLRAVDIVDQKDIVHIPKILYHWRTALGSTAAGHENKKYAHEAGRRALAEHLQRRKLQGEIGEAPEAPGMYRVHWQRPEPAPLVSIIIPTRNGHDILKQCLDSLTMTTYPHYEVIVIDNGSDDHATLQLLATLSSEGRIRVLSDERPFNFSALNNRAVRELALGEFVLLMNNDIEVTHPEWLDEMVGPAMEPGVGCVGARLWYPDGRLQHGGVVLVCGVAGHAHKFLPRGMHGYMGRAVLAQDFVAVTAACLLVRRAIYDEVGGLDESLAVAFNDVDFCLKVHQAGYRNHWTPYAELVHHESLTRGYEDTPEKQARFKGEIDILQSRWSHLLQCDPCYNPNLTADAEDFSLAWPPRVSLTGGTTS